MKLSKRSLTVFVLLGVIAAVAGIKWFQSGAVRNVDPVEARAKGPADAPLQIIEFIDFECPACAYGAQKLKNYMERYPGRIRVEVKYYPLMNVHSHALQAASYMECTARQGRFWDFFDSAMSSQGQWAKLVNIEGVFDHIAEASGVNMGQLKQCLTSEEVATTIMAEKSAGRSMGVQSTPTYFINKKMVVGAKSLEEEMEAYFKTAK